MVIRKQIESPILFHSSNIDVWSPLPKKKYEDVNIESIFDAWCVTVAFY